MSLSEFPADFSVLTWEKAWAKVTHAQGPFVYNWFPHAENAEAVVILEGRW